VRVEGSRASETRLRSKASTGQAPAVPAQEFPSPGRHSGPYVRPPTLRFRRRWEAMAGRVVATSCVYPPALRFVATSPCRRQTWDRESVRPLD